VAHNILYQQTETVKADYKNYNYESTTIMSLWQMTEQATREEDFNSRTFPPPEIRSTLAYREHSTASIETVYILPISAQYPELTLESTWASMKRS